MLTPTFHPPYGTCDVETLTSFLTIGHVLSYSDATRKSYTQISLLHDKEDCWLFRGVYRLPHLHLTRIQRRLLIVASIVPPTHMLPLLAITVAPHLRFGSLLLYTAQIALYDTAAIHKYPCFVALTSSACASARWFSVSSLSSYSIFA